MLKGYHYTTYENYLKILKTGLQPYQLSEENQIKGYTENGAVWVFKEQLVGNEIIGQIIFCVVKHGLTRIVCLEVMYPENASVKYLHDTENDGTLKLEHGMVDIGILSHYHAVFDLILKPCHNFTLVGSWDLGKVLNNATQNIA